MIPKPVFSALRGFGALFLWATTISAYPLIPNDVLERKTKELASHEDYAALTSLIDSEEARWKAAPSMAYFDNMWAITVLLEETKPQLYWLGRKAVWNMLLKPMPNEYLAPMQFYDCRYSMFHMCENNSLPYVNSLGPEMFQAVRHDIFLMLSEYARQLHATIIPGYRDKYAPMSEIRKYQQNTIDNWVQRQAQNALRGLASEHLQYLIEAYSRKPQDDSELKTLLDILNVQGADRKRVMSDAR